MLTITILVMVLTVLYTASVIKLSIIGAVLVISLLEFSVVGFCLSLLVLVTTGVKLMLWIGDGSYVNLDDTSADM